MWFDLSHHIHTYLLICRYVKLHKACTFSLGVAENGNVWVVKMVCFSLLLFRKWETSLKHTDLCFALFPITYAYFRLLKSMLEMPYSFICSQKTTIHATNMNNVCKWSSSFGGFLLFVLENIFVFALVYIPFVTCSCFISHLFFETSFSFHPMLIGVNPLNMSVAEQAKHMLNTFFLISDFFTALY